MSSVSPVGRSTATISVAQTAPIRIHHLTEHLADDGAFSRWLPEAAAEALNLCNSPAPDASLFERALVRDPALAAQVISIAGAGLFAPRATLLSVREAVVHLGLEATRDVLLMIVTNGLAVRAPGFEALGESLRRRALAAGIATRLCAKSLRVESGHDFLVGLMHDIGEQILLQRCIEEGILVPGMLEDAEDGPLIRETIDADHTRVGGALCTAWKLPPAVIEAAEFHHAYRAGRRSRLPAHLAAAADAIVTHATAAPASHEPLRNPILTELSLPQQVVANIVAEVSTKLPAFAAMGSTAQR